MYNGGIHSILDEPPSSTMLFVLEVTKLGKPVLKKPIPRTPSHKPLPKLHQYCYQMLHLRVVELYLVRVLLKLMIIIASVTKPLFETFSIQSSVQTIPNAIAVRARGAEVT